MKGSILYLALLVGATAHAEDLQYLDHSEIALARLYTNIKNAESTIDLSYLIWDPCSTAGKVITRALQDRAKPKNGAKPVKVRLLLDDFFQKKYADAMQTYYDGLGIELKFYNPDVMRLNYHTHSKLALFDKDIPGKATMVTGGRNVADEYYGMAKHDYVDRDVAVTGPSAKENRNGPIGSAKSGFDRLWANPAVKRLGPPTQHQADSLKQCARWTAKDESLRQYLDKNGARLASEEKPISCQDVSFTMDDMSHVGQFGPNRAKVKPTSQAVLRLVSQAQKTLTMENQYFVPDDDYMKPWLNDRKKHGVKIDMYSNMFDKEEGIESLFDKKNMDMVNLQNTKAMREMNGNGETNHMNFRIAGLMDRWLYSPEPTSYTYHAKTFVADGKDAIVSSFNIDPRSMNLNGESALFAKNCPAFAKRVEDMTKLTGKVWTLEENLKICVTGTKPSPAAIDPLTAMVELFTKHLQ